MVRCETLYDLAYFTGSNAGRAYVRILNFSVAINRNPLQIGEPPALARVVRMADAMTDDGPFSTDFAFSAHYLDLP